jgi:hypothetical protein
MENLASYIIRASFRQERMQEYSGDIMPFIIEFYFFLPAYLSCLY